MDVFLMPSLFEGLPVVGIEAQASGLPCVFSDTITDEIILSDRAVRLSLEQPDEVWAKELIRLGTADRDRAEGTQRCTQRRLRYCGRNKAFAGNLCEPD